MPLSFTHPLNASAFSQIPRIPLTLPLSAKLLLHLSPLPIPSTPSLQLWQSAEPFQQIVNIPLTCPFCN
jgi:hypothetical protein